MASGSSNIQKTNYRLTIARESVNALVAAGFGAIAAGGSFSSEADMENARVMFATILTVQAVERGLNMAYGSSRNLVEIIGKGVLASAPATVSFLGVGGSLNLANFIGNFAPFTTAIAAIDTIRAAGAATLDRIGLKEGIGRFSADVVLKAGSVFIGVAVGPGLMQGIPISDAEKGLAVPFAIGAATSMVSDVMFRAITERCAGKSGTTDEADQGLLLPEQRAP